MTNCQRNTIGLCVAALLLGGCARTLNEEVGLSGIDDALPALSTGTSSSINDEPSLSNGLDRRHWSGLTVPVPLHQVQHNIAFGTSIDWCPDAEVGSKTYPNALSALQVQSPSAQVVGCAALELVALPASWLAATIDSATDGSGLSAADHSPRTRESFDRIPNPESEYVWRWIIEPESTTGEVAAANE